MEAIFGAVFREAGFDTAQRVILKLYDPILTGLTLEQMSKDPKTRLQELLQEIICLDPNMRSSPPRAQLMSGALSVNAASSGSKS